MTNTETMRLILSFYRFDMPLYKKERTRAIQSKKKALVGILKKYGKYTFLIMLCVNLIYLLKKAGVHITLTRAMQIVSVSTLVAVLLISSAIVYLLMREPEMAVVTPRETATAAANRTEPVTAAEKTPAEVKPEIRYRMQIADFTCMPSEKKITASFIRAMKRELIRTGGTDAAAYMRDTPDYQAPVVLTGSVTKSTDGYMIMVRVVDSTSSEVKMFSRNSVTGPEDFNATAKKVAEEILRAER